MLREPIAVVLPTLGVAREVERVAKRLRRVTALDDRRQIEHRERNHS
jgi:hypothetical protein